MNSPFFKPESRRLAEATRTLDLPARVPSIDIAHRKSANGIDKSSAGPHSEV